MSKKKPNGYWRSEENAIAEAREIMEEHGFDILPGGPVLRKLGHNSLSGSITKYHGGFNTFRKLLGQDQLKKPRGYWMGLENTKREACVIIEKHGFETLPGSPVLRELGYGSFTTAVNQYHGGIRAFRDLLGQEQRERPKRYWKDIENVKSESERIMEEHGFETLPGKTILERLGRGDFVAAINKYHGGLPAFRKIIGMHPGQVESGRWKDFDFTIEQTKIVMETHSFETLPGCLTLNKLGYSSLGAAIQKYHGGFPAFRELLRERQGLPSEEQRLESLLQEYVS